MTWIMIIIQLVWLFFLVKTTYARGKQSNSMFDVIAEGAHNRAYFNFVIILCCYITMFYELAFQIGWLSFESDSKSLVVKGNQELFIALAFIASIVTTLTAYRLGKTRNRFGVKIKR